MKRFLIVISAVLIACSASSSSSESSRDWTVEIRTEGGITGRGVGNVSLSSKTIGDCDHAALDRALAAAKPKTWKREYFDPAAPHGRGDAVLTTMTVTIDGESATTAWHSNSREMVPADALAVYDAAWALRGTCQRDAKASM